MPRGIVLLILLLVILVGGAFFLAGQVKEQPVQTIEVDVDANAATR